MEELIAADTGKLASPKHEGADSAAGQNNQNHHLLNEVDMSFSGRFDEQAAANSQLKRDDQTYENDRSAHEHDDTEFEINKKDLQVRQNKDDKLTQS